MKKQYTKEEIEELRNTIVPINASMLTAAQRMTDQEKREQEYQTAFNEFEYKNPSANEKRFIEYRIKVLEKVLEEYYETADIYEGEELDGKEWINGVWTLTRTGTASDYWGFMDKLDFMKDKLNQFETPKQVEAIEINPYPLVFINAKVYKCFIEYTNKHILVFYIDYSYLKKRLEHENLIHKCSDYDFLNFLFNEELISEKNKEEYSKENKFRALGKSRNEQRENNFNNVFEGLF